MIDTEGILRSVNLTDLISINSHLDIRNGRSFCPFCQSKSSGVHHSPAFAIYDRRFHCFRCEKSGDAFDYIMFRDNVDFKTAAARLGWQGVEITEEQKNNIDQQREQNRQVEEDRRAHELAGRGYISNAKSWRLEAERLTKILQTSLAARAEMLSRIAHKIG